MNSIILTRNVASSNSFVDVRPYVYGISWTKMDKHYIGARTVNRTKPEDDFWHEYFTSSQRVELYRKKHGEPDRIVIYDTFDQPAHAFSVEADLLTFYRDEGLWGSLLNRVIRKTLFNTPPTVPDDVAISKMNKWLRKEYGIYGKYL